VKLVEAKINNSNTSKIEIIAFSAVLFSPVVFSFSWFFSYHFQPVWRIAHTTDSRPLLCDLVYFVLAVSTQLIKSNLFSGT